MHPFDPDYLSPILLARPGRTIAADKGDYLRRFPDSRVVFNANLCTPDGRKIWYGDLDVTRDEEGLRALSAEVGSTLLVLCEMDGRFDHEHAPRLDRAVARVTSEAVEHLKPA